MLERIRRNRACLSEAVGASRYRDFSAANASRFRESARLISAHATGRVLDVGCGHMPFRDLAVSHAASYEGLDIEPRVAGVDYVTDVCAMTGVPRNAFDTVLCFEVLEHLSDPSRALGAMAEVLRPGGKLLATAPHLSRLHEEPHDYFRYTGYGLRALVERAGLEVIELTPHAGVVTFLAHQVSTVVLGLVWGIPGLRQLAYQVNRFIFVYPALWMDRVVDRRHLFPLGYALVARKPAGTPRP